MNTKPVFHGSDIEKICEYYHLKKEDIIDPAVGLVMKKRIGDFVKAGECWCTLHVGAASDLNQARSLMDQALSLSLIRQPAPRLIHAVVDAQGTHYIEG